MKALLISAALLLGFTAPAQAQSHAMTCTRDYYSSVNLRTGPSQRNSIIASIPNQSYVRILTWVWGADNMRWYRVEYGGLVGFMRSDYMCR
ncbi:MAG: SH3 domain-containing protein [Gammaproteobacteria bacterium]|nr:SH3 domain-containing protein [Gammaproteobacteria bacterium]